MDDLGIAFRKLVTTRVSNLSKAFPVYRFPGTDGLSRTSEDTSEEFAGPFGITSEERANLQTTEEWLQELETGIPVYPAALDKGMDGSVLQTLPDDWDDRVYFVPQAPSDNDICRPELENTETIPDGVLEFAQLRAEPDTAGCSVRNNARQVGPVGPREYSGHDTFEEYHTQLATSKPAAHPQPVELSSRRILRYDHHRTANYKAGILVLSFVCKETNEEVVAFFNVNTKIQRGPNKGKSYPHGVGGRFLPLPKSAFRKFWSALFGDPRRWSETYKELRPRMNGQLFTADIDVAFKKDGTPFLRAKNLKVLEAL